MADIVLHIKSLTFRICKPLQNAANCSQVLNKLIDQGLLTERWQLLFVLEFAEILEIYTGLHKVDNGLHGFALDSGERWICTIIFNMLDVLLVKVL